MEMKNVSVFFNIIIYVCLDTKIKAIIIRFLLNDENSIK